MQWKLQQWKRNTWRKFWADLNSYAEVEGVATSQCQFSLSSPARPRSRRLNNVHSLTPCPTTYCFNLHLMFVTNNTALTDCRYFSFFVVKKQMIIWNLLNLSNKCFVVIFYKIMENVQLLLHFPVRTCTCNFPYSFYVVKVLSRNKAQYCLLFRESLTLLVTNTPIRYSMERNAIGRFGHNHSIVDSLWLRFWIQLKVVGNSIQYQITSNQWWSVWNPSKSINKLIS